MQENESSFFEKFKDALPDWMQRLFGIAKRKVEVQTQTKNDLEKLRIANESITRKGVHGNISFRLEIADAVSSGYDTRLYSKIEK